MIRVELIKRRPRGRITVAAAAAVGLALVVLIGTTRAAMPDQLGDWATVVTNSSGFAMPLIVMNAMLLFLLPLCAAVFAGESVAGEAAWGSLRYLMARPVTRTRILWSKAATAALFCLATVVAVEALTLVAGLIAFGWKPLAVIDVQHTTALHLAAATFSPVSTLGRLVMATGFVIATLAATFSFAFFLSTLTSQPVWAVTGGIGLWLASRALDDVRRLHALSPWLPATDAGTTAWTGIFTSPAQTTGIYHELVVQLAYSGIFMFLAWLWFIRTDVLS